MPAIFYPGQPDYIDKLNELVSGEVILTINHSNLNGLNNSDHPASAITVAAIPGISATNVQAALVEIDNKVDNISGSAVDITISPISGIVANNVQTALVEIDAKTGSGAGTTVANSAPFTPVNGQGWLDTNTGISYTWVNDGDSSAWVENGSGSSVATIGSVTGLQPALDTKAALSAPQTFTGAQRGSVTTLTSSAASIAINLAANNNFAYTTVEDSTLAAPSNPVAGQMSQVYITQGATPRLLAYNTFYKFPFGIVPSLTTTASAVDLLVLSIPPGAAYAICQLIKDIK